MGKQILSIDLGESSIKFLLCEIKSKERVIKSAYVEKIPLGMDNWEEYAFEKIKETIKEKKWSRLKTSLVLNSREMNIRGIKIPKIPEDEIQPVILREAKKLYGDLIGKRVVYEVTGEVVIDERSYYSIFFILINEALIERVESTGIKFDSIDFGIFSIDRVYRNLLKSDLNCAVIDMGATNTEIFIYNGSSLEIYREMNIGSNEITETISNMLQVEVEEAEILKRKYGYISKEKAENMQGEEAELGAKLSFAYQWALEKLIRKISNSIEYFKSQNRGDDVDKIYLCGNGSKLLNIEELLKTELSIQTIDCYSGMELFIVDKKIENISEFASEAPGYVRLFGNALLTKDYLAMQKIKDGVVYQNKAKIKKGIAVFLLLFPIIGLYVYNKYQYEKNISEIKKLTLSMESLSEKTSRYDEIAKEISAINADSEKLKSATLYRAAIPDFLKELTIITSDRIYFTDIEYSDGKVILQGNAVSEDGFPEVYINDFFKKLENKYKDVVIKSTKKLDGKSADTASFEIELTIDDGDPALKKSEADLNEEGGEAVENE